MFNVYYIIALICVIHAKLYKNYFKSSRAIETLSTRLKDEEITNQKLKELIIAERIKHETYVCL